MRVGKFGVQEQVELWIKSQFLISHLDVLGLTLLDNSSGVDWLDNCINGVLHVLNQHWLSTLDGELDDLWHLWVVESGDLEIMLIPSLSQPGDTLKLWIDDQGVSLRVSEN